MGLKLGPLGLRALWVPGSLGPPGPSPKTKEFEFPEPKAYEFPEPKEYELVVVVATRSAVF